MEISRRDSLTLLAGTAASALGVLGATQPAKGQAEAILFPEGKPNFLFILADNLGYGELGC